MMPHKIKSNYISDIATKQQGGNARHVYTEKALLKSVLLKIK